MRTGKHRLAIAAAVAVAVAPAPRAAVADPTLTTLVGFTTAGGADPTAGLVVDAAGNLYGTTAAGGPGGGGTAFELPASARTQVFTLHAFAGTDGSAPNGLTFDPSGNLFGTTRQGGGGAAGTAFELTGATRQTLSTVATFAGANGQTPEAGPTVDAAGDLYGTTYAGGANGVGTVFKLDPGRTLTTLVSFNASSAGQHPAAPLVADAAGNLYGTTGSTVFELAGTDHQTFTTLATFTGTNGAVPGALAIDPAGNLYGTTTFGGSLGAGTAFELAGPTHQALTTLATFGGNNGAEPLGGLTIDAAGNLYGTTSAGGANNAGTAFRLSGATHQLLSVLADFNPSTGSGAAGPLAVDAAGTLYGTTTAGGPGGQGTAFQLADAGFTLPAVAVANNSTAHLTVPAPTGPATAPQVVTVAGVTVGPGGTLVVDPAPFGRVLVDIGFAGLNLSGSFTTATSRLELGTNDLNVINPNGPSPAPDDLATETARVAQGYNGGRWNGAGGITSAAAAADPTHTTALGVIQNDQSGTAVFAAGDEFDGTVPGTGDVLVKYTYYGDANLDGRVDGQDYGRIDAGYLSGGTLTGWYNGDFNYDGRVDGGDYTLIDNAFNGQRGNLSTATGGASAVGTDEVAAVPEPAGVVVEAFVAGLLCRRRRRANHRPPSRAASASTGRPIG